MLLLPTIRAALPGGNPQRRYLGTLLLLPARLTHRNLARVVQHTWAMSADGSYGRDNMGLSHHNPSHPASPLCARPCDSTTKGNRPDTTAADLNCHGWFRFHCWYSLLSS